MTPTSSLEKIADATGIKLGQASSFTNVPTDDLYPYWVARIASDHAAQPLSFYLILLLSCVVVLMLLYGIRQALFSLNRLYSTGDCVYNSITCADWPKLTVFIAAHNEERVIADCMTALLAADYPAEHLKIVAVNDRSSDGTAKIIDDYVARHAGRIHAFHRSSGKAGKAAALKDAMQTAQGDIVIVFDADYTPDPDLLKQLVAPFFDPEVGAVMGHVVPKNVSANLLTRMLDLERSAGYQVDQQARMNMGLVPQYGGTVGGVRLSAVEAVGGWADDVLAEDTDITFRLLIGGWKTIYNNQAHCYEEVPEEWSVRIRQVHRWAKGHNQVLLSHWVALLTSRFVSLRERIDGLMLMQVFLIQPMLLLGWGLVVTMYYLNSLTLMTLFLPLGVLLFYGALGSFSAFFQTALAVLLDGHRKRIRLLPIQVLCFCSSLFSISSALVEVVFERFKQRELVWNKTARYRKQVSS
jgi:cellulose synthase/poly-beta-1,6-N-acetylglucosamine synthase-like glycosyltransferase